MSSVMTSKLSKADRTTLKKTMGSCRTCYIVLIAASTVGVTGYSQSFTCASFSDLPSGTAIGVSGIGLITFFEIEIQSVCAHASSKAKHDVTFHDRLR